MRQLFHMTGQETSKLVVLGILCISLSVVVLISTRYLPHRYRYMAGRFALLVAFSAAARWAVGGGAVVAGPLRTVLSMAGWLMALPVAVWAVQLQDERWSNLRRAIVVGSIVFVGVQPLLVAWRAPDLSWPPRTATSNSLDGGGRPTTIFLLFDELNSIAAGPFINLLRQQGLQVQSKALTPVGDGTSKVIPALFTNLRFDDPKPCSPTAVCSEGNILDYSRITASRPDVDIVGFFQPYCSIRGLRYCARVGISTFPIFEWERWRCAFWLRIRFPESAARDCEQALSRGMLGIVRDSLPALANAPIWAAGGFLFAHLALPHPPGLSLGSSLQTHYQENLDRALAVLGNILALARNGPAEQLRIVIFSDHPLRQKLWCQEYMPYARRGCTTSEALVDTMVPLIVAGNGRLPPIEGILSNAQIFSLAANWR